MDGRKFLNPALVLAGQGAEEHWRAATGRAYDALFLECRDTLIRWGHVPARRDNVHTFVRLRFTRNAHADLRSIGADLEELSQRRNEADYQTVSPGSFATSSAAQRCIQKARDAIALLDQITSDPTQETAAIAAIQAAWP